MASGESSRRSRARSVSSPRVAHPRGVPTREPRGEGRSSRDQGAGEATVVVGDGLALFVVDWLQFAVGVLFVVLFEACDGHFMRYFERYELLVDLARALIDDLDDFEAAILLLFQDYSNYLL